MNYVFLFYFFLFASCANENTKFAIPINQEVRASNTYNETFRPKAEQQQKKIDLLEKEEFPQNNEINQPAIEKSFIDKNQKFSFENDTIKDQKTENFEPIVQSSKKQVSIDAEKKFKPQVKKGCVVQFGVFSSLENANKLKLKIENQFKDLKPNLKTLDGKNFVSTNEYSSNNECYTILKKVQVSFPDSFVLRGDN